MLAVILRSVRPTQRPGLYPGVVLKTYVSKARKSTSGRTFDLSKDEHFQFPPWLARLTNGIVVAAIAASVYKYVKGNLNLVMYRGCVVDKNMVLDGTMEEIDQMECRESDVFVASFPKSGTTWLQEIVYLIIHRDLLCLDNQVKTCPEEVTEVPTLESRFPYLEFPYPGVQSIKKMDGQRLIKTHLPVHLLPESCQQQHGPKVLYIYRNPKDVAVSYYHFARMLNFIKYQGTFIRFAYRFTEDTYPYQPYFPHLAGYLEKCTSNPTRFLAVAYEDLKEDPKKEIRRISSFLLGPNPENQLSEEEIDAIADRTSFQAMKENPSTNYKHWDVYGIRVPEEAEFMRKGVVGDHENYFTNKYLISHFNDWVATNAEKFGLSFSFHPKDQSEEAEAKANWTQTAS